MAICKCGTFYLGSDRIRECPTCWGERMTARRHRDEARAGSVFVEAATIAEARRIRPGAAWYQRHNGGYLVFDNYNDYQRWKTA